MINERCQSGLQGASGVALPDFYGLTYQILHLLGQYGLLRQAVYRLLNLVDLFIPTDILDRKEREGQVGWNRAVGKLTDLSFSSDFQYTSKMIKPRDLTEISIERNQSTAETAIHHPQSVGQTREILGK